jgi:fused signal recognition particle receptor
MLDFLKRKKDALPQDTTPNSKLGFFARLKEGLSRTRRSFRDGLAQLLAGKKEIDAELLEELESLLLSSDMGIEVTARVITALTQQVSKNQLNDIEALSATLKNNLRELLLPYQIPLVLPEGAKPFVILMIGVNGTGKTTTIGKLARIFKVQGKKVILAAGDTFRAAAVEQLQSWGERNEVPVIAQHSGADSASVIFDAVQAAHSRQCDVLIADTAGRLHTQDNLMEELKKIVRVMKKIEAAAPHEVFLVLDAGVGQNALNQAKKFHEAIGVTGIVLTKLDGTAKGGIIFNIAHTLKLPIRFIGVGEGVEDLRPFEADAFVDALFSQEF